MIQPQVKKCSECGLELGPGGVCSRCGRGAALRLLHRELVLLVFLALLSFALYLGTRWLAGRSHAMRESVAGSWYLKGQEAIQRGDAGAAIAALRKAAGNDHDNPFYLRSLATALQLDGRDDQAEELLVRLRDRGSEDPEINLQLARISVRQHKFTEAVRYYNNALYGIWINADQRRNIRRELIDFYLSRQAKEQALAEIIAFAAHLPDTEAAHNELGQLFLEAGEATRALDNFTWTLRHDKRNSVALRGAGEAAFQVGNYARTEHFLRSAPALDSKSQEMLSLSKLILESDPLEPHLSIPERNKRVTADLDVAIAGLQNCASRQSSGADRESIESLEAKLGQQKQCLSEAHFRRNSDLVFSTLDSIADAERALAKTCGPLHGRDMALWLLTRERGTDQ